MKQTHQTGFTLIELSVVLVIVGLLVGGILVGQDLIRAAEVRSIITDSERFRTAVNAFHMKYNALPGDMPDATQIWGTASGGCPNGVRTGTQTCDGDGNGQVSAGVPEVFTFWQHLSNAGMISGVFSGVDGPANTGYHSVIGFNVPASKYPQGGYTIGYWSTNNPGMFLNQGHNLQFGGQTVNNATGYGIMPAGEAFALDQKVDDGLPGTGQITTYRHGNPYNNGFCATTTDPTTAVYDVTNPNAWCSFMIRLAF